MAGRVRSFVHDDNAAVAIEYALMATLIAIAVVTVISGIGAKLSGYFSEVSSALK